MKNYLKNVSNFQVTVRQLEDGLDFCHKIEKGGSNKSYGIEAARLAGVPIQVITNAKTILKHLEKSNNFNFEINLEEINKSAA